ncbi:MAG: hypothetical protein Q8Q89_01985 [bacterium]|nr:hypothetical protein [bacterium]
MREFLKPTKFTIIIFIISVGLLFLPVDHPLYLITSVLMIPTIIIIIFLGVLIPTTKPGFLLLGGSNLTGFGMILEYVIYLLLAYFVGSIISRIYYKRKNSQ